MFYSNSANNTSQQTFFHLPDSNNLSDSKSGRKVPDLKVRVGHMLHQTKLGASGPISQGIFSENVEML